MSEEEKLKSIIEKFRKKAEFAKKAGNSPSKYLEAKGRFENDLWNLQRHGEDISSLNNFGQATNKTMRGLKYIEGTAVWTKNSKGVNNVGAVNSIFPHSI